VNSAPLPALVQAFAPDFARRLGLILAALAAIIARRFPRDPRLVTLIIPLCRRINRAARRFERLMARLAAGTLPKPRMPGTPPSASPDRSGGSHPAADALPRGRFWLVRALGHEAAACATQLQALLAEPGAAEILGEVPAAGRIIRPLIRLLAIGARQRPARTVPAPEPAPIGKVAVRSQGYTWYEIPTPPANPA
jgi:hypothetical protein